MASINSAPSAVQSRAPSPRTMEMNAGRAGLAKGCRKLSTTDEKVVADCRQRSPGKARRSAILVRVDRDTTMCDRHLEPPRLGRCRHRRRGRRRARGRARRPRAPGGRLAAGSPARPPAGDAAVLGVQAPRLAAPGGPGGAHSTSSRRCPKLRAAPRTVVGLAAADRHQRRDRSGGRPAQRHQRASLAAR